MQLRITDIATQRSKIVKDKLTAVFELSVESDDFSDYVKNGKIDNLKLMNDVMNGKIKLL